LGKFSSLKRGANLRKSPSSKSLGLLIVPVIIPRPEKQSAKAQTGGPRTRLTNGRVADNGNTKLSACVEQSDLWCLDIQRERRVFDLDSTDWCNLVCSSQALCRALAQSNVLNLALVFQLLHCLDCLLNRCHTIETMAVVKVDAADA